MSGMDFAVILKKYAELIIKVGLNLQPGQRLFIWAEQLEVAPLVRQVVELAYKEGSQLVLGDGLQGGDLSFQVHDCHDELLWLSA